MDKYKVDIHTVISLISEIREENSTASARLSKMKQRGKRR